MKNHWLKQREINNEWHNFSIIFDASKTEIYVDGELVDQVYNHEGDLTFVQYVDRVLREDVIREIMLEEDARFMEIVSAAIDESPELDVELPDIVSVPFELEEFDRPLEHHIDTMGI